MTIHTTPTKEEAGGPVSQQQRKSSKGMRTALFVAGGVILALIATLVLISTGGSPAPAPGPVASASSAAPVSPPVSAIQPAPSDTQVPATGAGQPLTEDQINAHMLWADKLMSQSKLGTAPPQYLYFSAFDVVGFYNQLWDMRCSYPASLDLYQVVNGMILKSPNSMDPDLTLLADCTNPGFQPPERVGPMYSNASPVLTFNTAMAKDGAWRPYTMTVEWHRNPGNTPGNPGHWLIADLHPGHTAN